MLSSLSPASAMPSKYSVHTKIAAAGFGKRHPPCVDCGHGAQWCSSRHWNVRDPRDSCIRARHRCVPIACRRRSRIQARWAFRRRCWQRRLPSSGSLTSAPPRRPSRSGCCPAVWHSGTSSRFMPSHIPSSSRCCQCGLPWPYFSSAMTSSAQAPTIWSRTSQSGQFVATRSFSTELLPHRRLPGKRSQPALDLRRRAAWV